jgi:hypothetical protein
VPKVKEGEKKTFLIRTTAKKDEWPIGKSELVNKHIKQFTQCTKSIDFEKI